MSVVSCSPTLIVYCDIIPTNYLAVPSPSLRVYMQGNKCDMRNLHKQMSGSFLDHYVLFQLAQLLSVGIVDVVFRSAGTGKYARPTRHFKFHFILLTVSYEILVKSKTIRFLLIRFVLHQIHSSYLLTNSTSYFQKCSLCGFFKNSWRATIHGARDSTTNTLKLFEALCRMTFSVRCAIASHLVEWAKDNSVGTVIAKVFNCIPRFVYIDATAFLYVRMYACTLWE